MTTTHATASPSPVVTFATRDVDEAARIGSELFVQHEIEPLQPDAFDFAITAGAIGTVKVGESSFGGAVRFTVGGLDEVYGVSLPRRGSLDVSVGSTSYSATPAFASVVGPVGELGGAGWHVDQERVSLVRFDRGSLEAELGRMLGREVDARINFELLMDVRNGAGADWTRFARSTIDSLRDPKALTWHPMLAAQTSSALMTGLLLAAEHPYREALDAPVRSLTPPLIARAAAYIDEHAHDPLTVPGIAAAVGISTRALQVGFGKHLDATPSEYLVRIRMARAHRELVAGSPDRTTVAQVAANWGFFHAGRFAARYCASYGTAPSATLRGR